MDIIRLGVDWAVGRFGLGYFRVVAMWVTLAQIHEVWHKIWIVLAGHAIESLLLLDARGALWVVGCECIRVSCEDAGDGSIEFEVHTLHELFRRRFSFDPYLFGVFDSSHEMARRLILEEDTRAQTEDQFD